MKEIKAKTVYLEEYDVNVNCYLTYAQIQQIVDGIMALKQVDGGDIWAARQTNIDMGILFHATDIGADKLEEIGHDVLVVSGLIDEVNKCVKNAYEIYRAIDYTESTSRAIGQVLKEVAKNLNENTVQGLAKKAKKVMDNASKK